MPTTPAERIPDKPEALISPAAMRIVRLLAGSSPMSVADLIDDTGVTRTAVTEQLNELLAGGYVERATEAPTGRGRPRHLYRATGSALAHLFAGNQRLLVPAMWDAITHIGGEELKRKVLNRVSRTMAKHYRDRIKGKTPRKRAAELAELLREEGSLVDVEDERNGQIVVRIRACQFYSMFEDTRSVCAVDQNVLRLVLGAPVRQVDCRHDGDACCSFAIRLSDKK
jgi:predicted ArsR family transcriptional regulator